MASGEDPKPKGRVSAAWARLSSLMRRRIVLGALVALSVAAFDLLLLVVSASLFALSELAPSASGAPRAA